jgi:glutathione synthase/RimK-type ligase-like ATP-grasp enzyme
VLETEIEITVDGTVGGTVWVRGERLDLGEVTAVYLRPYEWRRLPAVEQAGPDSPEWHHALAVEDALVTWVEITPALVLNRPAVMASNASKPYQAAEIQAFGFAIPATLVTTDPAAARAFWREHGEVIYKSVSGTRSIVSRLTAEHVDRLEDISWCPTQFQKYIPGTDYRVHVVGSEVFASEILSAADDYRYAVLTGSPAEVRPATLPEECAARCRKLAAAFGLGLAGIDLRRTSDGEWYCFEVNTSPGFTYFEEATGQPITQAVARFLAAGSRRWVSVEVSGAGRI